MYCYSTFSAAAFRSTVITCSGRSLLLPIRVQCLLIDLKLAGKTKLIFALTLRVFKVMLYLNCNVKPCGSVLNSLLFISLVSLSSRKNQYVIYIRLQKDGCSEGEGKLIDSYFQGEILISPHVSCLA